MWFSFSPLSEIPKFTRGTETRLVFFYTRVRGTNSGPLPSSNINHKGLQRAANEYAEERLWLQYRSVYFEWFAPFSTKGGMITSSWDEAKRNGIFMVFQQRLIFADVIHCILLYKHRQGIIERRRVVAWRYHGIQISESHKPWSCKYCRKKLTWMTFLCMITLRNKTVARQWKWPSLSKKIVEMHKFCYHRNVTSHFSLSWWKWTFSPSVFYNIMWQSQEI